MAYNVSRLTTASECDQLLASVNDAKSDLQFSQTNLARQNNDRLRSAANLTATLATVSAQITAFTAARDAMPEGPDKDNLTNRLRRLNDRKENLEERQNRSGAVALLDNELELSLIAAQMAVFDSFADAVTDRKNAILNPDPQQGG